MSLNQITSLVQRQRIKSIVCAAACSGAEITQSITDGDTTHSPSGDAVSDALALKQDALSIASLTESLAGSNNTKYMTPLRVRSVTKRIYNVEAYGAVHDGQVSTTHNGTITSGTPNLACAGATFTSADVGKLIRVSGAGAAGAALATTILAFVDATHVTLAANASSTTTASKVDWGTDDTAAIQAAIDAVYAARQGVVYFPNGIYVIAGALVTTDPVGGGSINSQLYIPGVTYTEITKIFSITFEGESHVDFPLGYTGLFTSGAILQSFLVASGVSGTRPAIIGTKGPSGGYENFNYADITFKNLEFRTYTNKGTSHKMGGIDMSNAAQVSMNKTSAVIDVPINGITSPSGSSTFGIFAGHINNNNMNTLKECFAGGFEYGFIVGEHVNFDMSTVFGAKWGVTILNNVYTVSGRVSIHACIYQVRFQGADTILGIIPTGSAAYVNLIVEAEQIGTAEWWGATTFIDDASNAGYGTILYGGYQATPIWGTNTGNSTHLNKMPWSNLIPNRFNTEFGGWNSFVGGFASHSFPTVSVFEHAVSTAHSNDSSYHPIFVTGSNQTGTNNIVAQKVAVNYNGSVALMQERILTAGATNTGSQDRYYLSAGSQVQTALESVASYRVLPNYYFGGVGTTPTARVHIAAGTTAASTAPIKLTTGTSMTTAEAGAVEFTTDDLFFTITTGAARKRLLMADAVGGLTANRSALYATTNGRIADVAVGIDTTAGDAATINSLAGRFRKDTSGSTFTLTNSFITANSIIMLTIVTAGITAGYDLAVAAGSGSAVITFQTAGVAAAPNANCDVNFIVMN